MHIYAHLIRMIPHKVKVDITIIQHPTSCLRCRRTILGIITKSTKVPKTQS